MTRNEIYQAIERERLKQDAEWGGPAHDDKHTTHDWVVFIVKHVGRAVGTFSTSIFIKQMTIVAALAVAAIEWAERAKDKGFLSGE